MTQPTRYPLPEFTPTAPAMTARAGVYDAPTYFAAAYFPPTYYGVQTAAAGRVYDAPTYFAASYFPPIYYGNGVAVDGANGVYFPSGYFGPAYFPHTYFRTPGAAGGGGQPGPDYFSGGYFTPQYFLSIYGQASPGAVMAVVTPDVGPALSEALEFADLLSQPVPLPGSALAVMIPATAVVGSAWTVTAAVPPSTDPAAIVAALEAAGDATLAALFGVDSAEPYRTLRAIWDGHDDLPIRLGAAALALAYRTDALRAGTGA